jgi:phosphinothricin acetyltransferase
MFRNANIEDLPFIVDVYNSIIPGRMVTADTQPLTIEERKDWFHAHHEKRPIWIAEHPSGQRIGWLSFKDFYGRPAYLGTSEIALYISEEFRGHGWGEKMLREAITQCPSLKIHTLLGFIFAHNEPSIRLFEKSGFELWGRLPEVAEMDEKKYSLKIFGRKV